MTSVARLHWPLECLAVSDRIKHYNYMVTCLKEDIIAVKEDRQLAITEGNLKAKAYSNEYLKRLTKHLRRVLKHNAKLKRLVTQTEPVDPFDYWLDSGNEYHKKLIAADETLMVALTIVSKRLRDSPFADTHCWFLCDYWNIYVTERDNRPRAAINRRLAFSNLGSPLIFIGDVKAYIEDSRSQAIPINVRV